MIYCELSREGLKPSSDIPSINTNSEFLRVIDELKPDRIILFRAGLIINKKIINSGIHIMNIHAAKIPDFGGIGSIHRAIQSGAYSQFASLHVITSRIDKGQVLDFEEYNLDPYLSYCNNEMKAYQAGKKLLLRTIESDLLPNNKL